MIPKKKLAENNTHVYYTDGTVLLKRDSTETPFKKEENGKLMWDGDDYLYKNESEEGDKGEGFTPGEWVIESTQYENRKSILANGKKHTVLEDYTGTNEAEANARLIASAPDMYHALKTIADCNEEKTKFPLTKSDAKGFVKIAEAILNRINNQK